MLSPIVAPAELITGQRMNVAEFLSRWEDLPDLKNAELIDGVVYVPSPVSLEHGSLAAQIIWWLAMDREVIFRELWPRGDGRCHKIVISSIQEDGRRAHSAGELRHRGSSINWS